MNFQFEKNKLYNYLGQHLVNVFKEYRVFIAGGLITSLFNNKEIKDVDVYFRSEKLLNEFIEEVYEDGNDWINALTTKALLVRIDDKEVQMIHFRYFENAEEIFDSFDYTVCMGAFDFFSEEFVLHEDFLKHNSQRILKFNKNTAYPVVSLLRVHKYKEKGYTISKPEFLRIALKCMGMKIETIEHLKEHLGGMYGINYDKLIKLKEGEEFSLDLIIDKIADLSINDDYFKEPEKVKFNDVEEIIEYISKEPTKVVTINDYTYRIKKDGTLKQIDNTPKNKVGYNGEEFIANRKFYKFVEKRGDKYFSFWDKEFEYKIDQKATPKRDDYLYFNEKLEISSSSYSNSRNAVLIEATIPYTDFYIKNSDKVLAKSCIVTREVPKAEYEKWENEELEDYKCPFELE
ncbi:hypothetical protein SAMN04487895_101562 [Paenibacillus sophorae]|uniref:Uncharacterized protein n=1 Tax=Paenibacillus sophorae TaxID=1333845 RepID=A0A1H8GL17_9BACL|nr:hypothetical protein [Paenibacillus sophorae]QWU14266.1 hypothetical protein KP014_20375 [Paenibacillus sophorae]SEN44831.1 hypothetical protein SAMN04487895_101562 [Paenibacillus sophorae]